MYQKLILILLILFLIYISHSSNIYKNIEIKLRILKIINL